MNHQGGIDAPIGLASMALTREPVRSTYDIISVYPWVRILCISVGSTASRQRKVMSVAGQQSDPALLTTIARMFWSILSSIRPPAATSGADLICPAPMICRLAFGVLSQQSEPLLHAQYVVSPCLSLRTCDQEVLRELFDETPHHHRQDYI